MTVDTEETGLCMDDFHWEEAIEQYRFECTTGGSFKFYEVELVEDGMDDNDISHPYVIITRYGSMKPGAHVTVKRVGYPSRNVAQRTVEVNIRKRIDHGYRKVS